MATMNPRIVISGCSGGGKSSLLAELKQRGYATVEEPGRRIVHQQTSTGGQALPWLDMAAFVRQAIALSLADYANAANSASDSAIGPWVFFDRSVIDAAAALQELSNEPVLATLGMQYRYHTQVFLAPPWPQIYLQDADRRHGLAAAQLEFERLQRAYPALGYTVSLLPKLSVAQRADFVLSQLAGS